MSRARVVLGATCYADAAASLQIAVVLAREISGDIHGCLVADDDILASVSYPNARAVAFSGQRFQAVTEQSLRAAFRADARLFEAQLISAARQASLEAAFSQSWGGLRSIVETTAGADDLMVFGFRRGGAAGSIVTLICCDTRPDPQILALGAALARRLSKPLSVMLAPSLRDDVAAQLGALGVTAPEILPADNLEAGIARLERLSPAAVLVGARVPDTASVLRVIDAARCPVIVPVRTLVAAPNPVAGREGAP